MKSLHLAIPEDAEKLLPLVAAFHAEMGFDTDGEHQNAAVMPLLEGSPHGAIWLIGPRRAPVGYICITFGWSLEYGGLDGIVDELYIRPAVRRRGMGGEALNGMCQALRGSGVKALHLEVDTANEPIRHMYRKARFSERDGYCLMSRVL
ncbi:GNAT family N-acetyltransferase [Thalassococcus sp. CAU 1522]|uniref:GNAT family N-acetyltransferase n=1 Tax=Thalassococcus arenae TaxID=2851652 RepID=A0ABS6NBL1_9RHOB|nr:GNAT family N-acetyltransferase [Thalassococcus arenae]MBV2361168.1 GNAT family N-acetyltransferase [Thalassococcus arenae]